MELIRRRATRSSPRVSAVRGAQQAGPTPYALRRRAEPRAREILDAITALDTNTDELTRRELMGFIESLYETSGGGLPIGLFATCYLGGDYLDHVVNFDGDIVKHFKGSERVPDQFAAARPLARNDAYTFIEVYSDGQVVPVRADLTPAI